MAVGSAHRGGGGFGLATPGARHDASASPRIFIPAMSSHAPSLAGLPVLIGRALRPSGLPLVQRRRVGVAGPSGPPPVLPPYKRPSPADAPGAGVRPTLTYAGPLDSLYSAVY